jgi:beta-lactamase superfamily II metal-dependent hydrolase
MPPGADHPAVRVRMYNVGFGDCLLFHVPTDDGERTVLVDCGAHMSGSANPISTIVADLVAAVTVDGTPRIDVVVATHRHYDHISGFALKAWKDVEVGEVWMPWTEERGNPAADALRHSQHRLAARLQVQFPSIADPVGWLAANSLSNKDAEHTLLAGFVGAPLRRYLPAVERAERTFTSPLLPGVTVHALGPSHTPATIALMDPPAGKYFPEPPPGEHHEHARTPRARRGREEHNQAFAELFAPRHRVTVADYTARHGALAEHTDAAALRERSQADYLGAASALEDAINGTSLVLVLELGDHCILLGGDAEWGTWSEVLDDAAWLSLIARTAVYKVSHHGSFNGTPKPFVDDVLPADAISLMSFRPVDSWPSIPRESLIDALRSGQRTLYRTDMMPVAAGPVARNGDLWMEVTIPLA